MPGINYIFAAVTSLAAGTLLLKIVTGLSLRRRLFVSGNIPLTGGLAMGLAFFLGSLPGVLLYGTSSSKISGVFFASLVMLLFGLADDRWELSILAKFSVQIIATLFLILSGVRTQIVFLGDNLNIIVTFIWVIGITNAFNHLDVMDGLAASNAVICGLAFFVIACFNRDTNTAIMSLALSAAATSFLFYNFPPARVYMGNAGSHFLGFVLACVAILATYASGPQQRTALFSPLFVLGFPIYDTAFLIVARVIKKSLPFKKSNDHLALRLLALGYPKKKALVLMGAFSLFFAVSGIALNHQGDTPGLLIIFCSGLAIFILSKKMSGVKANG
ncbi:MAG: MraY family glycosyltransferase [Candidatus Omnitrophota bacterium]